jgi:hypothetical protein
MTRKQERDARDHASHIALRVHGNEGGPFELRERYGRKRLIGRYKTVDTLRRGIWRYHDRELVRLDVLLGERS